MNRFLQALIGIVLIMLMLFDIESNLIIKSIIEGLIAIILLADIGKKGWCS